MLEITGEESNPIITRNTFFGCTSSAIYVSGGAKVAQIHFPIELRDLTSPGHDRGQHYHTVRESGHCGVLLR